MMLRRACDRYVGLALIIAGGLAMNACASQPKAVDLGWVSERPEGSSQPANAGYDETQSAAEAPPEADGRSKAMLGVRHDLTIAPSATKTAKCSCLAVEVGNANEPKFQWQSSAPELAPDAMIIAVSTRGVSCPGGEQDESKRRASISAVDRDGADVVIEIEEVPEGRPIASGAIIPKPGAGGAVYVRPRNAKLIYGRSTTGARCKVQ